MSRRVVVIGGGHNGLVAAALLAKHGLKVQLLEARHLVGGAAVTEEFHPGFKASTVAHVLGPLRPSVMEALDLPGRGLRLVEPDVRLFAPTEQGGVVLGGDPGQTAFELRKVSARDAEQYPVLHASLTAIASLASRLLSLTPPDIDHPISGELFPLAGLAMGFRSLGREDAQRLLRWGPMAVADFAHEWFETEALRAVLCARGIFGAFAGPWSAGTTANLLLSAAHDGGNAAGHATQAIGGLGAVTAAMAAAARQYGAEIRTGARVERIVVKDGRAAAVVLANGDELPADAVVSAVDPGQTFLRFVDPALFDPDEFNAIRHYRQQGMASKVLFALDGLPGFGNAPVEWLKGRIHVGASVDDLERAYDDGKYGRISARPYLDITIPTLSDPTLAPEGRHVMSVHAQFTPYRLAEGDWDTRRDEVADVVTRAIEQHAPGFTARVLHRHVITPLDLERTYGITGGHPFHGEHALDQLFFSRPLLGWARYRAPIERLYLCSAGTHPGGGVTGAPAANAVREILKDLK